MERFTTLTQWRILKYSWRKQDFFTLEDLLGEGILHRPALGRLTLKIMEARGQMLSRPSIAHEREYMATTDSKEEWKEIWAPTPFLQKMWGDPSFNMRGVNRYERAETIAELEKILEDFKKQIETEEKLETVSADTPLQQNGSASPL